MPKEQCIGFNHLHVVDADHVLMVRIGWQPGYDSLTARDSRGPDCWRAEVRCVPADDHGAGCVPRHSPVDRHWSHWYPMRLKFRRRVCVFRNVWMASFRFSRIFCDVVNFSRIANVAGVVPVCVEMLHLILTSQLWQWKVFQGYTSMERVSSSSVLRIWKRSVTC